MKFKMNKKWMYITIIFILVIIFLIVFYPQLTSIGDFSKHGIASDVMEPISVD